MTQTYEVQDCGDCPFAHYWFERGDEGCSCAYPGGVGPDVLLMGTVPEDCPLRLRKSGITIRLGGSSDDRT